MSNSPSDMAGAIAGMTLIRCIAFIVFLIWLSMSAFPFIMELTRTIIVATNAS